MKIRRKSAELLSIIANTIGVDPHDFEAWQKERTACEMDKEHHRTALIFRLLRAFRSLPDGETRLQALHFVEALAAVQGKTS